MILATPFDLTLFGADESPQDLDRHDYYKLILDRLDWSRLCFQDINHRLGQNPATSSCRLQLPMTENLYSLLSRARSVLEICLENGGVI